MKKLYDLWNSYIKVKPDSTSGMLRSYLDFVITSAVFSIILVANPFSFLTPIGAQTSGANVQADIIAGSSTKTTDSYAPNPININVGDTVTWTNKDTQPHTVTSGSGQPDGKFDSSPNFNPLMGPQQTFSHTFEEAGEYPYYCGLHVNMVGTVIVAASGSISITVATDKQSYEAGDDIEISGLVSDPEGITTPILIEVIDPQGNRDRIDQVDSDGGSFSLVFVAGAQMNTEGTYTVRATYKTESDSTTFQFGTAADGQSIAVTTDEQSYRTNDGIVIRGSIGNIVGDTPDIFGVTDIHLEDTLGKRVSNITPGERVVITAEVVNNINSAQPFVVILELRDPDDQTKFLSWQTGIANERSIFTVGMSWTPENYDLYEIRVSVVEEDRPLSNTYTYDVASGRLSSIDIEGQPVLLRIDGPAWVRFDQVQVAQDGSFQYETNLGDYPKLGGTYQVIANYDGEEKSVPFTFSPLPLSNFVVNSVGESIPLKMATTSTINDIDYDLDNGRLSIALHGSAESEGVLYATFPNYLLDDVYRVELDGSELQFQDISKNNPLYTELKMIYSHSHHNLTFFGIPWSTAQAGEYLIKYKWWPCGDFPPCKVDVSKDADVADLYLQFWSDGSLASQVSFSGEIDTVALNRETSPGNPVLSVPVRTFSDPPFVPYDYSGTVTITKFNNLDVEDRATRITVTAIPEFTIIMPTAIATIFIAVALAIARSKFEV